MKPVYTFGICNKCKQHKALKNGYCIDCLEEYPNLRPPQFLREIFNFGEDDE